MTHLTRRLWLLLFSSLFLMVSCKKEIGDKDFDNLEQTKTFSSEVAQKWQDLQFLKLLPLGDYTYETPLCVYTLAVKLKHQS